MCGIAGIWNEADERTIQLMTRTIAHRGPDGLDFSVIGRHSVGAARLAILGDPSASAVFTDPSRRLTVLFNGEIYNVESLRQELSAKGFLFNNDLESEVLAKRYLDSGLHFAKRLKGMFALALVDGDRLVLARDRFGIKPLYYAHIKGKIVFGSEIKAVMAHPMVQAELNQVALEEIAVFGYVYSPTETPFSGIKQVEPGSVMVFDRDRTCVLRFGGLPKARYVEESEFLNYDQAVLRLRERVIGAVQQLFEHGVQPKGLYLSGGLDSTTIAVVAREILGYPLTTFTLADNEDNDDFVAAGKVAKRLGTKHVERIVGTDDYFDILNEFIYHYETPVAGGVFDLHGAIAFHLLTETVSQHVKVAFSGEGADELFGGYYWIYTHPLGFADRIRTNLKAIPAGPRVCQQVDDLFPLPEDELTYRRNTLNSLLHSGLANYHLQSVDRSCGAFGFEVRPLYLQDDLADFAASLPIEYKVPNKMVTKRIFRDAFRPEFERLGLEWVLSRPKYGMPAALCNIAPFVQKEMESRVSDTAFAEHPLRAYLGTKMSVYLFDLFSRTFQIGSNYVKHYCSPQ